MYEIDAILEKTDEEIINDATAAGMDIDAEVEKIKAIFEKCRAMLKKATPTSRSRRGLRYENAS